MIVEGCERQPVQDGVMGEPRIGRHGPTPGDLEIEPCRGRDIVADRGREAPWCPGRRVPLASVSNLHGQSLRTA